MVFSIILAVFLVAFVGYEIILIVGFAGAKKQDGEPFRDSDDMREWYTRYAVCATLTAFAIATLVFYGVELAQHMSSNRGGYLLEFSGKGVFAYILVILSTGLAATFIWVIPLGISDLIKAFGLAMHDFPVSKSDFRFHAVMQCAWFASIIALSLLYFAS